MSCFQRKRNGDQRAQDTNINLGLQPQMFSGARQVTCTHIPVCPAETREAGDKFLSVHAGHEQTCIENENVDMGRGKQGWDES